jgi:hypothetical protein
MEVLIIGRKHRYIIFHDLNAYIILQTIVKEVKRDKEDETNYVNKRLFSNAHIGCVSLVPIVF